MNVQKITSKSYIPVMKNPELESRNEEPGNYSLKELRTQTTVSRIKNP